MKCSSLMSGKRWMLLVAAFSFVALIAFIIAITVAVGAHAESTRYLPTLCNVTGISYYSKKCSCGSACHARQLCLNINVRFNRGREIRQAKLYKREGSTECTFTSTCSKSEVRSLSQVNNFKHELTSKGSINCFYDRDLNAEGVLMEYNPKADNSVRAILIISIFCVVLSILSAVIVCGCKYLRA